MKKLASATLNVLGRLIEALLLPLIDRAIRWAKRKLRKESKPADLNPHM